MRRLLIIGIGVGNPDHLTVQAIDALNRADVFFMPDKGEEKAALRHLRQEICERFVKEARYRTVDVTIPRRAAEGVDYHAGVDAWHASLQAKYEALFAEHLAEGECGAFLVWGEPALYDSTLRIIERIAAKGLAIEWEAIPGISAVQVLAARHRMPLNRIGSSVLITTGRRIAEGFPETADTVVVMLDGDQAFRHLAARADLEIFWGAYLGTTNEILVSGKLSDVAEEILRIRRRLRDEKGWIMDTYLLRRAAPG
jgi:precorrin-6A synthase